MTTLMKAPDIFAFIALLLLSLLIVIWGLTTFGMARLLKSNGSTSQVTSSNTYTKNKDTGRVKIKARRKNKK
jgi:hypothetical protein